MSHELVDMNTPGGDAVTIAVLGAGVVGTTLATGWSRAGHTVVLGSRQPEAPKIKEAVDQIRSASAKSTVTSALHGDAVGQADVVVIAVPGGAVADLVGQIGSDLAGKLVIDTTNSMRPDEAELSSVAVLADAGAMVFRAFNTVGHEQMAQPTFGAVACDMFFAGPDTSDRALIGSVISDLGFRPVYLGDGAAALAGVDAVARLWFLLAFGQGWGRRLGLRVLSGEDD